MRVQEKRQIAASRDQVWAWLRDPCRYPDFWDGVDRWEVVGDQRTGRGARWDVRLRIGAAPVGGTVEVVEFDEPGDLAWNSVTGVTMRGRWRLRERSPGHTEVQLRLAYQAPGGLMGLIADRVAAPLVSRSLKRSLRSLQMLVETQPVPELEPAPKPASNSKPNAKSNSNSKAKSNSNATSKAKSKPKSKQAS